MNIAADLTSTCVRPYCIVTEPYACGIPVLLWRLVIKNTDWRNFVYVFVLYHKRDTAGQLVKMFPGIPLKLTS